MGHLCSCHRAEKARYRRNMRGKAASHDHLLSSPKYNGMVTLAPPIDRHRYFNGYYAMPTSPDDFLGASLYATAPRSMSMRISNPRKSGYSTSTLGPESGFSSKASSSLDNTNHSCSTPSSPHSVWRRKPPPKPPRMRNYNVDHRLASTDTLLSRTPTPSLRSTDVSTLKSSIVDVTNALDSTFCYSFDEEIPSPSPMVKRYNATGENQAKVYNILAQTKQILAFELDPEPVLSYLSDKDVISLSTEEQIRRTRSKQARCDFLIDVITAKGPDEFMVFCDALRSVGCQMYLADFLEALDSLVEIALSNKLKPVQNIGNDSNKLSFDGGDLCMTCACNNNKEDGDICSDSSSFDIDITYVQRDTGETRTIQEIASMKRRRRPLSITSEDFALLEEADKYIPMMSVRLYNQCLVGGGVSTISHILEQYPCVRELSLVKNHIDTAESMNQLTAALEKNRSLAHLDIRLNSIGDDGSFNLAQSLSKHSSLRLLNVTSTGLCGVGCSQLVHGVSKSSSLVELNFGFNEMTEQSCEVMCRCLSSNNTLRKLRMRCNNITPYGARCIFKGLKRNARVHYVDISRNKIKDESISMLAEVLLLNRTLKGINLENCAITGEGCAALARALKTNTSLRSLDLSMNPIGDSGAQAIGEGLKYNQAIDTMCLNMCNIGNTGFLHILDALRFNTSMKTLKLCYNKIGNPRYPDIWQNLKNLPEVCLSDNDDDSRTSFQTSSPTALAPRSGGLTLSMSSSSPSTDGNTSSLSSKSPLCPVSFTAPLSPLTSTLRHPLSQSMSSASTDPLELMYESLCEVLQQNKDLKVLLWGNNFDDGTDGQTDSERTSFSEDELNHSTV